MSLRLPRLGGMPGFFLLWLGQAFSLLGGSMALFAVTLWIYQNTGEATPVALLGFFNLAPLVFVGLFAGAWVDRSDRRLMLALGDVASLVVNVALIVGAATHQLQLWWIYTAAAVLGTFQSFQWPATSAAVTQIVEPKHYGRTASLLEMAGQSSGILAPLLAGALLGLVGLPGVLLVTAVGSVLALCSLLFLDLPGPPSGPKAKLNQLFAEIADGFRFVVARPSLIAVQCVFLVGNFFYGLAFALLGPMVLAQTGNNALAFAAVETAGALGGLAGSGLIAVWGGPRSKVAGILLGWSAGGLFGLVVIGLGPQLVWWMVGAFVGAAMGTLDYTSNQALWQSKVPSSLQGRVFSVRRLIGMSVMPLASLAAGPLADRVFEPALRLGGALVPWVGGLLGTGPGAGMRFLFLVCGLVLALVGPLGWRVPAIRLAEARLPDAQ